MNISICSRDNGDTGEEDGLVERCKYLFRHTFFCRPMDNDPPCQAITGVFLWDDCSILIRSQFDFLTRSTLGKILNES